MKRLLVTIFFIHEGKLNVSMMVEDITSSSFKVHYSISPEILEVSDLTFSIHYNSTTSVMQSSQGHTSLSDVVTLTGLTPNTDYSFWITAEAPDGITVTGDIMVTKTLLVGKLNVWPVQFCIKAVHVRRMTNNHSVHNKAVEFILYGNNILRIL